MSTGPWQGAKDCFDNWWLILAAPGSAAARRDPGHRRLGHRLAGLWSRAEDGEGRAGTFGKGDVRGVIASESANNAKEGGSLIPTIAFGVPGSAGMAILLGAFLMHGLVPGPDMLTKNLPITYSMVWSIALANILGAGLCYAFSGQFAKLATLRYTLVLPAVLCIIYIGAFEGLARLGRSLQPFVLRPRRLDDEAVQWPRPPLILGVVLGDTIERYLFISIERYGVSWFARPVVAILFLMAFFGLVRPLLQDVRIHGGVKKMLSGFGAPRFHPSQLFTIFVICLVISALIASWGWGFKAWIVPAIVSFVALLTASLSLFNDMCRRPDDVSIESLADETQQRVEGKMKEEKIHMDMTSDTGHLPVRTIAMRGAIFFTYLVAFMASMATIGLIPTAFFFVIIFMRIEGPEPWTLVLTYAVAVVIFIIVAFDKFMAVPWPQTLVGTYIAPSLPFLKMIRRSSPRHEFRHAGCRSSRQPGAFWPSSLCRPKQRPISAALRWRYCVWLMLWLRSDLAASRA